MRKRTLSIVPTLAVLAAAGLAGASPAAAACGTGAPLTDTSFTAAGVDCYIVPAGVESVRVTLIGGRGGSAKTVLGGYGAIVQGTLEVHSGDQLDFIVGSNGASSPIFFVPAMGGIATRMGDLLTAGAGGGAGSSAELEPAILGGRGGSAGPGAGPGDDGQNFGGRIGGGGGLPGGYGGGGAGGRAGASGITGDAAGFGFGGFPQMGPGSFSGGGGDGYFGGGSGGPGEPDTGSGGGGGGSSFVDPSVQSPTIGTDAGGTPQVIIVAGGAASTTTLPASGLDFTSTQPQTTTSAPQSMTISSNGSAPLRVDALEITGADADDFFVSGDTCRHTVAIGGDCRVSVRFNPQAAGTRSATLEIRGNAGTTTLALTGTGGALPTGVTGALGATGPSGTNGTNGTSGTNGKDGQVLTTSCVVTSRDSDVKARATLSCDLPAIKTAQTITLSRAGKIVATGTRRRDQTLRLTVRKGADLTPGRYGLTRRYRIDGRAYSHRRLIDITAAQAG